MKRKSICKANVVVFNDKEDVLTYIDEHEYDRDTMKVDLMCAYLIKAREMQDEETVENIVTDIMIDPSAIGYLEHFSFRKFDNYGIDELAFIYEDDDAYNNFLNMIVKTEREAWENVTWDYVLNSLTGNYKATSALIINNLLKVKLNVANKEWVLDRAKGAYPNLTENYLKRYVEIRKNSNYTMTLRNTSYEIVNACAENGYKVGVRAIIALQKAFGYKPEVNGVVLYNKEDASAKRFFEITHADEMTDEDIYDTCKKLVAELHYDMDDIRVIATWLFRARSEGYNKNNGIEVTDAQKARYCTAYDLKEYSYTAGAANKVVYKMRNEIKEHFGTGTDSLAMNTLTYVMTMPTGKRKKQAIA